jgi:hypothetical protein
VPARFIRQILSQLQSVLSPRDSGDSTAAEGPICGADSAPISYPSSQLRSLTWTSVWSRFATTRQESGLH